MKRSESIKAISTAILEVQKALVPAERSQDNPFFKSSYTDLSGLWDNCRDLLGKNGLIVVQTVEEARFIRTGQELQPLPMLITTLIHAPSSEWIESELRISAKDYDNPQAVGSAITYARRYAMAAILGLVSEGEDDDGERASGRGGNDKKQPEKKDDKPKEPAKKWQKPNKPEDKKPEPPKEEPTTQPEAPKPEPVPEIPPPAEEGPKTTEEAVRNVTDAIPGSQVVTETDGDFQKLYKEMNGLKKFQVNPWMIRNKKAILALPPDQQKIIDEMRDHIVRSK